MLTAVNSYAFDKQNYGNSLQNEQQLFARNFEDWCYLLDFTKSTPAFYHTFF